MSQLYKSALLLVQKAVQKNPVIHLFVCGYFACAVIGWLILQLPFCHKNFVSWHDTLFMAASAISTTGLATVDIDKTFSLYGQQVLLLLIQLGGVGYLILSSFIVLTLQRTHPSHLWQDRTIMSLVKETLLYTIVCELVGSIVLYFFFSNEGVDDAFWSALFHSVSAFCTAGLSLFSSNFESYKHHVGINIALSALSLLGAFGFFLAVDFCKKIGHRGYLQHIARVIRPFATTAIVIGSFLFLLAASFPQASSQLQQLLISCFHVISAITTAGYNTLDLKALPQAASCILVIIMLIGVTLTGSGTPMKKTSFPALLRLTAVLLFKKKAASARRQKILLKKLQIALFTFTQYLCVLLIFGLLLSFTEKQSIISLLFEAASALSTVGLSIGITAELSIFGKSLIVLLMLVGKIGVLLFGFATSTQELLKDHGKHQEHTEVAAKV